MELYCKLNLLTANDAGFVWGYQSLQGRQAVAGMFDSAASQQLEAKLEVFCLWMYSSPADSNQVELAECRIESGL